MKIIFSPSKSQQLPVKMGKLNNTYLGTQPVFKQKTKKLMTVLRKYSLIEIQRFFKVSLRKSQDIVVNRENFSLSGVIMAKDLFTGTAFKELAIHNYNSKQTKYFKQQVRILSALYGVLEPDNLVCPYRLDMTDNFVVNELPYKNMYDYWGDDISNYFPVNEIIINLASNEYSQMLSLFPKKMIINIHFRIVKEGKEKSLSVHTKQQRGKMLNHMVLFDIKDPLLLKKYSSDGFIFNPQKSDTYNYFFIKIT